MATEEVRKDEFWVGLIKHWHESGRSVTDIIFELGQTREFFENCGIDYNDIETMKEFIREVIADS